jgi:hypothetical protein
MDQGSGYRVRLARVGEVARLREIEDEAGTIFAGLGLIDEAPDVPFPLDEPVQLVGMEQVWMACQEDDPPVGVVIASAREGVAYVDDLRQALGVAGDAELHGPARPRPQSPSRPPAGGQAPSCGMSRGLARGWRRAGGTKGSPQ